MDRVGVPMKVESGKKIVRPLLLWLDDRTSLCPTCQSSDEI